MPFRVGDVITGKSDLAAYGITSEDSICVVVRGPNMYGKIEVLLVSHIYDSVGHSFRVNPECFVLVEDPPAVERIDLAMEEIL